MIARINRLCEILLFAFFIVLPMSKALVSIILVALLALGLLNFKSVSLNTRHPRILLFLPMFYYAWHLIGLLWSENYAFGWFDILVKLPLGILPIVLLLHQDKIIDLKYNLLKSLFLGLSISLIICLLKAIYGFMNTGDISEFFYTHFSTFMHPSYFAWELDVALIFLFTDTRITDKYKWFNSTLILFFSFGVILLNSKAGIAGWLMVCILSSIRRAYLKRTYRPLIIGSMACIFFVAGYKLGIPSSANRMGQFKHAITNSNARVNEMESTSTRLQVWNSAWNLIKKQPLLGTGTGDVKDELIKSYRESGFNFAADHQFNAHNQFLQSWLALGIFGLFLLASLFIIPIVSFWRKKELLMIIFLVVSYFNLLVESMLEKQDGVVFFALFYSLFLLIPFEEKKHLNSAA